MAIESYFFNAEKNGDKFDRVYNSQDITNYLNLLVSNGVFPNPSTQLQVVTNAGMKIAVKAGSGWIDGHKIVNTNDLTLTIDASDVILNRIDSIVFYVDHIKREMGIKIKKGVASANPASPTIDRNNNLYEMQIATIRIDKQVTIITQSMITDTRGLSSVCGWVQGLVQQASTETLFIQWQTAYLEAITKDQSDFDAWFADIKEHFVKATLVRQLTSNYKTTAENKTVIPINIPQFNLNLDILNCFINGMKLIQEVDYTIDSNTQITLKKPIEKVATQIEFEILKSVDGSDAEKVIDQVEQLQSDVSVLKNKPKLQDEIIDNLTSDDSTKVLSAAQGKVLKGLIGDGCMSMEVVNELPSGNQKPDVIYFASKNVSGGSEYMNKFVWIEEAGYWERIGGADLTGYATEDYVNKQINVKSNEDLMFIKAYIKNTGNTTQEMAMNVELPNDFIVGHWFIASVNRSTTDAPVSRIETPFVREGPFGKQLSDRVIIDDGSGSPRGKPFMQIFCVLEGTNGYPKGESTMVNVLLRNINRLPTTQV